MPRWHMQVFHTLLEAKEGHIKESQLPAELQSTATKLVRTGVLRQFDRHIEDKISFISPFHR